MNDIRVRFAPSPTGYLHVGGARTAIFNYLFAKKNDGKFYLRIEDTDVERSEEEMVEHILTSLQWLGIEWDGEPYYQSNHLDRYTRIAERLVDQGKAYYCYCTKERLDNLRKRAKKKGMPRATDRRCLHLSEEKKAQYEQLNKPRAIRFIVPDGKTAFEDTIHGHIEFDNSTIEDFVLLRSNGKPTYHLAVVADDIQMNISHVIRGDDHIANTPKQILLYNALHGDIPQFVHVPLILGTDKKRLSKRHGATSVIEYKKKGYLPNALFNYLTLLGWSPGDDREIMNKTELVVSFSLERINNQNAVFDPKKLNWMNQQYIKKTPSQIILDMLIPALIAEDYITQKEAQTQKSWLLEITDLLKDRMTTLNDFLDLSEYFFNEVDEYNQKGVRKYWSKEWSMPVMKKMIALIEDIDEFSIENLENKMRQLASDLGVSAGKVIHPTRLAITGRIASPGIFRTMNALGKDTVLKRLKKGLQYIEQLSKKNEQVG